MNFKLINSRFRNFLSFHDNVYIFYHYHMDTVHFYLHSLFLQMVYAFSSVLLARLQLPVYPLLLLLVANSHGFEPSSHTVILLLQCSLSSYQTFEILLYGIRVMDHLARMHVDEYLVVVDPYDQYGPSISYLLYVII